ncbi:MAG: hypothetical protein EHM61_09860 [Acidobacteria bacterium]|nr:MAG: hypothetical protein EHM61_09860 [Acidobacteriota bacterium]
MSVLPLSVFIRVRPCQSVVVRKKAAGLTPKIRFVIAMNVILFETVTGHLHPVLERIESNSPTWEGKTGYWNRIKQKLHAGYQKLAERLHHEELFCANLRHANHLQVVHRSADTPEAVEKKLRQFLRLGYSKHARWFWVDAVLAFFGMFLMFLPGPNIFFFYPAIRSFGHHQARKGARNGLGISDIAFRPDPLVDLVQANLHDLNSIAGAMKELENRYKVDDLEAALGQLGEK